MASGICSWIRFKLNDVDFAFEGNNPASSVTFEEFDKVKVINNEFIYPIHVRDSALALLPSRKFSKRYPKMGRFMIPFSNVHPNMKPIYGNFKRSITKLYINLQFLYRFHQFAHLSVTLS